MERYAVFFRYSKDIMEYNKNIQELFYNFSLNIFMIFYQENILNGTFEKVIKDKNEEFEKRIKIINNLRHEILMDEDEKEFYRLYRRTFKYKIYFEDFIRNSEALDVLRIPLIFSDEFTFQIIFINIKIYMIF